MSLSAERVLAAVSAFRWVPDPSLRRVTTDEFDAIEFPLGYEPAMMVHLSHVHSRPSVAVIDGVFGVMRQWGLTEVGWWLDQQIPAEWSAAVRSLSGRVTESVSVLACDLDAETPTWPNPPNLTVELVRDERTLVAADLVATEVWGGELVPESQRDRRLAELSADAAAGSLRVVAFLDGEPASTGRCTVAGDVARLWGACTRVRLRGRGAYGAVLRERLLAARAAGASFAWCTGRASTSAPILRRAGFLDYGTQECYLVDAAGRWAEAT